MNLAMFAKLTKVDAAQRLVYAVLASEAVDATNEVFDYESSKPYVEAWSGGIAKATDGKSVGNLRAMHAAVAAGKFTSLVCNDETKAVEVCAKVVDDAEWKKVEEGVYTGLSIGGKCVRKWKDGDVTRYTADPCEGSLVDLPCNPEAVFTMIKTDGSEEIRKFVTPAAPAAETVAATREIIAPVGPEQVWKCADGSTHATKALAKAHDEDTAKAAAAANDPAAKVAAMLAAADAAIAKVETAQADSAAEAPPAVPAGEPPPPPAAGAKAAPKLRLVKVAGALAKAATDRQARFDGLRKGLWTVSRFAGLIQELEWLQNETEYEAAAEADGSTVPADIKATIASLCAALRAMVAEETAELFDETEATEFAEVLEMAHRPRGIDALAKLLGDAAPAYLAKVGARHSKADKDHLDAAHDHLSKMGVGCGMAKAGARHSKADAENLTKAHDGMVAAGAECKTDDDEAADKVAPVGDLAKALSDNASLQKAVTAEKERGDKLEKVAEITVDKVRELIARIEKIESQPAPRKSDLRIVEKGDPNGDPGPAEMAELVSKAMAGDPDARHKLFTISAKGALGNPQALGLTSRG